ncbi:MAG: PilN domain-containing protein [Candidatus Omnitrophica bacterium]|nr:PilN domain-containing protein [Candidatus Omnitrophota bacterium]
MTKSNKNKKAGFVCSFTENSFKLLKYGLGAKREILDLVVQPLELSTSGQELKEKLKKALVQSAYKDNPLIISLPRNQATCRYLKVPAQNPHEIDKIANLQAGRFLPYPPEELVTAYDIISSDSQGYCSINLIIVRREVLERYLDFFQGLNPKNISVVLSSFSLCVLYAHLSRQQSAPVMLVDTDLSNTEIAFTQDKKLLFSRYFKVGKDLPQRENVFAEEANKTLGVYTKEIPGLPPERVVLFGETGMFHPGLTKALSEQVKLPVEVLPYKSKMELSESLLSRIADPEVSLVNALGFTLEDAPKFLNLALPEKKEEAKNFFRRQEYRKIFLYVLGAALALALGINLSLMAKGRYLRKQNIKLSKVLTEAQPLEAMEKRLKLLNSRRKVNAAVLDLLSEISRLMPPRASLNNFIYEEGEWVGLYGESQDMNAVLSLVTGLEKSAVMGDYTIKLKHATKRAAESGEIVDFEIDCLRR